MSILTQYPSLCSLTPDPPVGPLTLKEGSCCYDPSCDHCISLEQAN